MGVIAKGIPRGCQSLFTPVSLGYPLSVFNKNSTLNRIWRRLSVFCLLSVKVCSWYKTHSNTGILAGVRCSFFVSVPGFQFGPVTVSFRNNFRTQDDDVHNESRIYYCKQLDTLSRFGLSSYFTNSVEVLVDSIRRVCQL